VPRSLHCVASGHSGRATGPAREAASDGDWLEGGLPPPPGVKRLKTGWVVYGRASGGRKGVRGWRGGACRKPLVERGIGGEVGVFMVVVIVEVGEKGPIGVGIGVEGFSAG